MAVVSGIGKDVEEQDTSKKLCPYSYHIIEVLVNTNSGFVCMKSNYSRTCFCICLDIRATKLPVSNIYLLGNILDKQA